MADTVDLSGLERAEDRLQEAMRTSDVGALTSILHDDLVAALPDGRVVGKEEDLAAYRDGSVQIDAFSELDRTARVFGSTGVTIVRARIIGRQKGSRFDQVMRYTRTWSHLGDSWHVVAAHLAAATA